MKETFALYLEESIMFTTIFSLALRKTGTKTKLASSLLIMTKVGGAIGPVIMGYIANATGSMAIAFLIPMVCYGVIGGYALLNRHVSFWIKGEFSKITPSLFTLKEGSTSHPCPLSSGAREKTALLGARNRYALRLADQVRLLRLTTSVVSTSGRTSISSRWLSRPLIDCSAERKARIWTSSLM